MKLFYLRFNKNQMREFIKFSMTFNIFIYFTWAEENLFEEKRFFATVTNQPDNKITGEEKERLINENFQNCIIKIEDL